MAFSTEFIVDQVKVHPDLHGFQNAIALIRARWKITNSDHPDGFAYHMFEKAFNEDVYTLETFVAVDDVTDAMMESWLTSALTADTVLRIKMNALPRIEFTHEEARLTVHYVNPEL